MERIREMLTFPSSKLGRFFYGAAVAIAVLGFVWLFVRGVKNSPELVVTVITIGVAYLGNRGLQTRVEQAKLASYRREKVGSQMEAYFAVMREIGKDPGKGASDKQLKTMEELQNTLTVWGPKLSISAWADFLRSIESSPEAFTEIYTNFLRDIREDLGHHDDGLPVRDLLRLFITDIDETVPPDRVL